MQTFLRISIFLICIAAGVGLAIPLAKQFPPAKSGGEFVFSSTLEPKADPRRTSPEIAEAVAIVSVNADRQFAKLVDDELPMLRREESAPQSNSPSADAAIESIAEVVTPDPNLLTQQTEASSMASEQNDAFQQVALSESSPDVETNSPQIPRDVASDVSDEASTEQPGALPNPDPLARAITDIRRAEEDGKLELNLHDSDLCQVLDMICEQTGLNILVSPQVNGSVTATLKNVNAQDALAAVLDSTGFVSKTEGNSIYVGTPEEIQTIEHSKERLATRIYSPNCVKVQEIQMLVTPLLTPKVGKAKVSVPAEAGVVADRSTVGRNSVVDGEVLVVRDYPAVLAQVDQIVRDIDKRPQQVIIEVMIVSVQLNEQFKRGVDFRLLKSQANKKIVASLPPGSQGSMDANGGMKVGHLEANIGAFVNALETIGDTNVVTSPRLICLNKQRVEIPLGSKLSDVNPTVSQTSASQKPASSEGGTRLQLRPFINSDGTIRLAIHPELPAGNARGPSKSTQSDLEVPKAAADILCQDGATVVIGGLIREEHDSTTTQTPVLRKVPKIGPLFQHQSETIDRRELIVLITPRITNGPEKAADAKGLANKNGQREAVSANKMSPIGKQHFGERYSQLANAALTANDVPTAFRYANLAVHYDPMNRQATSLREEIVKANPEFNDSTRQRQSGPNRSVASTTKMPREPSLVQPVSYDAVDRKPVAAKGTQPAGNKAKTSRPKETKALEPAPLATDDSSPHPDEMTSSVPNRLELNTRPRKLQNAQPDVPKPRNQGRWDQSEPNPLWLKRN